MEPSSRRIHGMLTLIDPCSGFIKSVRTETIVLIQGYFFCLVSPHSRPFARQDISIILLDVNRSARNESVFIWTFARQTLITREKPLLTLYYTLLLPPRQSAPNEILLHLGSTVRNKSHSDDGDANFVFLSSPFTKSLLSSSPCQTL
ncbi:hypothetical protein AVEN_51829-1 [Araneus ventricosus]|uniref:Uncharacterized protein n=1 Tax=Araneus ventricosus TaxID=182803 RepID=A0A4Y2KEG4_ARAVE|nr:hypothetical protein AVEN_51829-1 [Araneus ventricosus]